MTQSEQAIIDEIYQSYKTDFNKVADDISRIIFHIIGDMEKHNIYINTIGSGYLTYRLMEELSDSVVECGDLIKNFIENRTQS